jgi:uncharacterized protein YcsI (UPF0317 family)
VFVGSLVGSPRRHRYKDGKLLRHDVPDILAEWREDSVGFFSASDFILVSFAAINAQCSRTAAPEIT